MTSEIERDKLNNALRGIYPDWRERDAIISRILEGAPKTLPSVPPSSEGPEVPPLDLQSNVGTPVSLPEGLNLEAIETIIRQVFTDEGIGRRHCDTCEAIDHECGCTPSVLELLNQRIINHIMSGIRAQISYQRAIASLGEAPKPEAPGQAARLRAAVDEFLSDARAGRNCGATQFDQETLIDRLEKIIEVAAPEPSPVVEPAPLHLEAIEVSFIENGCIDARVAALVDEIRRLRSKVEPPAPLVKGGVVETGKGGQGG